MLEARNLSKSFGAEQVLRQVSLSLHPGDTLAILGRSGSGKTTLLKTLAGLVSPDAGDWWVDGKALGSLPVHQRGMVYMYQENLLFPHLNVWENIAFGLKIKGIALAEIQSRVSGMLAALGLEDHHRKWPHALSGGQKQRVAFGRAIILNPRVLLLDEPFGSLDPETRAAMQALFLSLSQRFGLTSLFVTHDLREALVVGKQFGWMHGGVLTTYADRNAFLADAQNGAAREIEFWKNL